MKAHRLLPRLALPLLLGTALPGLMAAEPPATPPPATSVAAPASPLSARVDALLQKLAPPKGKVGVHLLDTASGAPLVARLDDEPLIPASNLKLVTTAAAALRLGPRFEWVTPLATLGTRRPDGVLEGDLLVVGDGDPDFSGRFHDGNPAAVFETWADDLARAGIREVTGGILLDDTAFDRERYPACWESRYYEDWFAAQVAALALNDNCADLTLRPGPAVGEPIGILASPSTAWIRVVNAARTVPGKGDDKIKIERPAGGNDIRVSGQLGVQCNPGTHYVTVHDPVMYFGTALKETLVRRGIAVQGDVRIVPADHDPSARPAEFLTEHRSPLPRALQVVNRRSQNLYAELLLRTLGRQARGQGTRASGVAAVAEALAPLNLPDPVTMEDGCGLARGNRVTARTMAALLARMLLQPEEVRSMYIESLAVPGGEGSLARRFVEESCRSRVKAKTGYINGVSTLSGYLETRQGKVVAFSVLVNGATDVSKAQLLQDSIVKAAIELE